MSADKIPDSHLQSPIRADLRQWLLRPKHKQCPRFVRDIASHMPEGIVLNNQSIRSEWCYGFVFSNLFKSTNVLKWVKTNVQEVLIAIQHHVEAVLSSLIPTQDRPASLRYAFSRDDLRIYSQKVIWEDFRRVMQKLKSSQKLSWEESRILPEGCNKVYLSQLFLAMRIRSNWVILDYEQVMMISDTISSRVFTILYHNMLSEHIPGKLSLELLKKVYSIFDNVLIEIGNKAYSQIKYWEAICLSILLHKHDGLSNSDDFYNYISRELIEEEFSAASLMLETLYKEDLTPDQLSELHGVYRHWGHPTVDEDKGCEKVRKYSENRPVPNYKILYQVRGLMKRQFCISFLRKHGRWPSIKLTKHLKQTKLGQAILRHCTAINLYSSDFSLQTWDLVIFEKEFDFDFFFDFTELADDKSISVYRSEIRKIYNKDILMYDPGKPTSHRRLLLELLTRKDIDIKRICEIIQHNQIPEEWKIIILHSKEREIKIDPRLFAMTVFEMRAYLCVTESNISNTIFEYFPQQTMTLGESELNKRLYAITNQQYDENCFPVIISIDFKSWNLHWSQQSTGPFFQVLDDLFGTPGLIYRTHQFFAQTLVALASHNNPPEFLIGNEKNNDFPDDEPFMWTSHKGGFEGLRQKGWTLITICLLLYVEFQTGIKSLIIGQGDNQVVKILLPLKETGLSRSVYIVKYKSQILQEIARFQQVLDSTAKALGLEVKLQETFYSSDLLIYGKDILYKGAFLSSATKKISRMLVDVNEIIPTIHDEVSTLQSAGLATAQKSNDFITPYVICQIETLFTLSRDAELSLLSSAKRSDTTKKWFSNVSSKSFLLHLSSDFGSCPVQPLLSFFYRGHPDSLTAYLTTLQLGSQKCDMCKRVYIYLQTEKLKLGDGDPEILILNPNSLNTEGVSPPLSIYRKLLQEQLTTITRNYYLKDIFSKQKFAEDEQLLQYLIKTEPVFPRFLHEVYRVTEAGTRMSFIAKFSNSRTTQLILAEGHKYSQLKAKIFSLENKLFSYWMEVYNHVMSIDLTREECNELCQECPTRVADYLRHTTWNETLKGHKMIGTTLPHPAHQFSKVLSTTPLAPSDRRSHECLFFKIENSDSNTLLSARGQFNPYIGSKTKEKISGKLMVLPKAHRPVQAAQRASILNTWLVSPNSKMVDFFHHLIQSRTNLSPDLISFTSGAVYSGSPIHRLDDHVTKRQTLNNFRPNASTHVYISTDTMGRYSRGQFNYNIHFQGAIHLGLSIIQLLAISTPSIPCDFLYLPFQGTDCLEQLESILISNEQELPDIPIRDWNPLIYTQIDESTLRASPKTQFFTMVINSTDSQAAAIILINRLMIELNTSDWGMSEVSHTRLSRLSAQDIIRIGIHNIIEELTTYLYLLFDLSDDMFPAFINYVSKTAWIDLAQLCLFPEVLPMLFEASRLTYANLYYSPSQVCRMIGRAINICFAEHKDKSRWLGSKNLILYIGEHLSMRKVLSMWARSIYVIEKNIDITDIVNTVRCTTHSISNLPSAEMCIQLYKMIYEEYGSDGIRCCFSTHRLKISKSPPESVLRISPFRTQRNDKNIHMTQLATLRSVKTHNVLGIIYTCPLVSETIRMIDGTYTARPSVAFKMTYEDHLFHLYGHLSTAVTKFYQIITALDITVDDACICLGDGEGGVSRLLIQLGAPLVFFNTLVNTSKLVAHRATSYTPAACLDIPNRIMGGSLSALTGGDLLDDKFLNSFLGILPKKVSILTCDAELKNPTPHQLLMLHNNIIKIIKSTKVNHLIVKLYMTNPEIIKDIVSMYHLYYKDIHIMVPWHSSNETYEVFLIASANHLNRITTPDVGYFGMSSESFLHEWCNEIYRDRIHDVPLQIHYKVPLTWYKEFQNSFALPSTRERAFEKFIGDAIILTEDQRLVDGIAIAKEATYKLCLEEAVASGSAAIGQNVNLLGSSLTLHGLSFHRSAERLSIFHINSLLLEEVYNLATDGLSVRTVCRRVLSNFLDGQHTVLLPGGRYYTVHLEKTNWERDFIKYYWVLIGHICLEKEIYDIS